MSSNISPQITVGIQGASLVPGAGERRDLIITNVTTRLSTVSTHNVVTHDVQNMSDSQIDALFGRNTHARMVIRQFLVANQKQSKLAVLAVPQDNGAAATGTLEITGNASEDGQLTIQAVDANLWSRTIPVVSTDTPTIIATKITQAFATSGATDIPITVTNSSGTLTFTARETGLFGNSYGIKVIGDVKGVTVGKRLTLSGGTETPSVIGNLARKLGEIRYDGMMVNYGWTEWINAIETIITNRFTVRNRDLSAVGVIGIRANYSASLGARVKGNTTRNTLLSFVGAGPEIIQSPDSLAAIVLGIRSRRLTPGAILSDLVVSGETADTFGGDSLASLPYHNTPLTQVPVIGPSEGFTSANQAELQDNGFTVIAPNDNYTGMVMGQFLTSRTIDGNGNPDPSFKYMNFVDTQFVVRNRVFRAIQQVVRQARLSTGGNVAGAGSLVTSSKIKSVITYTLALAVGDLLVRAGQESLIASNTVVTVNLAEGSIQVSYPLPIVTQVREITIIQKLSLTV